MKTHYIYTITNPSNEKVLFVSNSVEPKRRLYQHLYNSRNDDKSMPLYDELRKMLNQNIKPQVNVVDEITTDHNELVLRLAACWRWFYINDNNELVNVKNKGCCGNHNKPEHYIELVKKFADVPKADLQTFFETERIDALNHSGNFIFME